jgi:hypothetical protein
MIGKNLPAGDPTGPGTRNPPGISRKLLQRSILALAALMAAVSCIERSNPFDPINSGEARIQSVRDQLEAGLKKRAEREDVYRARWTSFDSTFRSDSSANMLIMIVNEGHKRTNSQVESDNAVAATTNATAPVESLKLQQPFSLLAPLGPYGSSDVEGTLSLLRGQTANLALFMSQANASNSPATIYPAEFSDSVLAPFVEDSASLTALRVRIDSGNQQVNRYNAGVAAYNLLQADANRRVVQFNDSVNFRKSVANNPVYVKADSLDAGTKAAKAGDVLLIGQGTYTVDLRFNSSGTAGNPILVRGYPGGLTVLHAPARGNSAMTLSGRENIHFQDIDFRGGVQIVSGSRGISFRRCVFDSGEIAGLTVVNSGVDLVDCRIIRNAIGASIRGALQGDASAASEVNLTNVLIAANRNEGIALVDTKGTFTGCTIADNLGEGLNLKIGLPGLRILSSIISGNGTIGVYRIRNTELQDQPSILQCDVWGNAGGDWSLQGLDSASIVQMQLYDRSIPPAFIDPANLDYGLQPGSALAELEHQAVPLIIGYRP